MNRWTRAAVAALSLATSAAFAQGITRDAPKDVLPAVITMSATPPIITVDGKPDRLSPGARIRDLNNMLVLSGAFAGKTGYTVYRRDAAGLVHEVWLLTEDEYRKLGGKSPHAGDAEGFRRFNELLALIFNARAMRAGATQ